MLWLGGIEQVGEGAQRVPSECAGYGEMERETAPSIRAMQKLLEDFFEGHRQGRGGGDCQW